MSNTSLFLVQKNQEPLAFCVISSGFPEDDRLSHHQEEESESYKDDSEEEIDKSIESRCSREDKKPTLTLKIRKRGYKEDKDQDHNSFVDDDNDVDSDDDDDDDGFKTPTYPETKIPAIERCPPAPRKPTPNTSVLSKRRKSEVSDVSRRLDFSQEVVSMFLADLERKIKKSPTEEEEDFGDDRTSSNI